MQSLASNILATDPADLSSTTAQEAAAKFAVRIHLFSLLFEVRLNSVLLNIFMDEGDMLFMCDPISIGMYLNC